MDDTEREPQAEENRSDAASGEDAPAHAGRQAERFAPPPTPVGHRRVLRNAALVLLALCLVSAAAGSVVLASQAKPAVPAHIFRSAGGAPSSATSTVSTTVPTQPTRVACSCGSPAQVAVPLPPGGAPNIGGQVVLVSLSQQWLWAFSNRQLVFSTPVTTGRPELPTPMGIYNIYSKVTNTMFYSPWPPGSPFYYSPEHVNYAMLFLTGGFFIHDAPWHSDFGPGTNVPHTGPGGQQETGSHGCVEVPTSAGAWLYGWAPYGTTVDIVG